MSITELLKQSYKMLLSGFEMTIIISVLSIIFATIIGMIVGMINISKSKNNILRIICGIYIDIIRGTPLIVQVFFIYFGIPAILGIKINATLAGVIAVSANEGAYMSEIFRGGILAIDRGQMEAARSLGLPYGVAMKEVVLPQAIRKMIPSIVNQLIISIKDTSILSVIGVQEVTSNGQVIMASTYAAFQIWSFVAIMYLIIIKLLSIASTRIERCLKV